MTNITSRYKARVFVSEAGFPMLPQKLSEKCQVAQKSVG